MKLWSEFYDLTVPDLPGCVNPMIDLSLRRAAIELCEGAEIWRKKLNPVLTQNGLSIYNFDIDGGQEVQTLKAATLNGNTLPVLRTDDAGQFGILCLNRREFILCPTPSSNRMGIVVDVVLKPSNTSIGVPDEIFAHYAETIASGAKARLMRSPKKPYTDFNLAVSYQMTFKSAIDEANSRVFMGYGPTRPRVRANFL